MSYCRWSSDDFKSDLYVYEHCGGYWTIHVAGNRVLGDIPKADYSFLEQSIKQGTPEWDAATARYMETSKAQSAFLTTAERVDIELPHVGETFNLPTPDECADKIEELVALGYHCPDGVVEELRAEAIATEAGTATTENTGVVHDGAGPQDIAQPLSANPTIASETSR